MSRNSIGGERDVCEGTLMTRAFQKKELCVRDAGMGRQTACAMDDE